LWLGALAGAGRDAIPSFPAPGGWLRRGGRARYLTQAAGEISVLGLEPSGMWTCLFIKDEY